MYFTCTIYLYSFTATNQPVHICPKLQFSRLCLPVSFVVVFLSPELHEGFELFIPVINVLLWWLADAPLSAGIRESQERTVFSVRIVLA